MTKPKPSATKKAPAKKLTVSHPLPPIAGTITVPMHAPHMAIVAEEASSSIIVFPEDNRPRGRIVRDGQTGAVLSHETWQGPALYKAVSVASGATVGASARSFGAALRDAGVFASWGDNGRAGMEYDGLRLEGGPPVDERVRGGNADGSITLPDGTKQFPNAPSGGIAGALPPSDPPRVPADWKANQLVRHKQIPAMVPVPILEVGQWTIRLVMQDNGQDKEVNDDWQNYDNLALL